MATFNSTFSAFIALIYYASNSIHIQISFATKRSQSKAIFTSDNLSFYMLFMKKKLIYNGRYIKIDINDEIL